MASFTDTQLPKFNPYIQQLPVEAMVAVGTQRQKAHDEGVQKIQAQIDSISGLEISRDVDKAYLQSKINEMGNKLRSVAGGDFSNFQLVNSVGGMTKQLANDPFIRAAVSSTANDKKEMALMDEDRKKGTLTPHAELFYNLKRQKYYSNPDLKSEDGSPVAFSGKYVQSWDLDKNMLEAIKGVGDSKWTEDNVFHKVNGQIARDKKGNPIYTEYATKAKREGKFSENVEAAIDGVLARPEAKQELTMRGVYNYRGYDNINDFIKGYETEKKKSISNLESKKLNMMEKVANATTPEEKAQYEAVVTAIDTKIEEVNQDAELKTSQALQFGSLDAYKAALETMKVKNSFMKSGVTEQYSTEVIENIPYNKQMENLDRERKWKMDLDASKRGWANINIAEGSAALEREKWLYDPKNPRNLGPATPTVLPLGVEDRTFYGDFMDSAKNAESNLASSKFAIVSEYMSAINHGNGKAYTKEHIESEIKRYEKLDPGFIEKMYSKAKKVSEDPIIARNPIYSGLINTLPMAALAEAEMSKVDLKTKGMNNSPEVLALKGKNLDLATFEKEFKPFTVTYSTDIDKKSFAFGGNRGLFAKPAETTKTVTAQDALDIATIASYRQGAKAVFGTPVEREVADAAQARLNTKFGGDISSVYGNPNVVRAIKAAKNKTFTDVLKAKEAWLKNHSLLAQPLAYDVYDVNMKDGERKSVDDRVKQVLNKYKGVGGLDTFNKLYTDPKNFSAQVSVDRGTPTSPSETFSLNLFDAGGKVKAIPISRTDAEYIKQTFIKLPPRQSEIAERVKVGGGTTNATGLTPSNPDAYKGAILSASYFSKKFNSTNIYGADIVANPEGGYNAYIYTTNPITGLKVGVPVKMNKDDIYPAQFDNADAAGAFLTKGIENKAFLESIIKTGF